MKSVILYSGALLVVAAVSGVFSGVVNSKCTLARELYYNGIEMSRLKDLLCVAKYSSSFVNNYAGPFTDGSKAIGIFRLNDDWWCQSPNRTSANFCKVDCDELLSDDFKKTVDCMRGFNYDAWYQWNDNCKDKDQNKPDYEDCFVKQQVCAYTYSAVASSVIDS